MSDRLFSYDAAVGLGEAWRIRSAASLTAFGLALRHAVTRRELAELDERMLADIGITRSEAMAEAARTPWDHGTRREQPRRRPRRFAATWQGLYAAWRRHATRQHICDLDAHALKDIGVSYAEAEAEANKPFWRA